MNFPPISDWKAAHVRVSFFANAMLSVNVKDMFQAITGAAASSVTEKPAEGEFIAVGAYGDDICEIRLSFNRLDVLLTPQSALVIAPVLSDGIQESLRRLVEKAAPHAAGIAGLCRLAVGAHGMFQVGSPEEAYEKINGYTGLNFSYGEYSDLQLQINTPRESGVIEGMRINRVTVWGCPVFSFGRLESAMEVEHGRNYFYGCISDVNTDSNRKEPIDPSKLEPLLDEMCRELVSVYESGVVKL